MQIALIGIGKIAIDQHVPALQNSDEWDLVATLSRSGKVEGVPSFHDFDEMLKANPNLEAVSLCMPPVPRFEYARRALEAGLHVMLEKPPGASLSECERLRAMAQNAGKTLFASWHSREAEQVDNAKKWLEDKRIQSVHVIWRENVRKWHPGQAWIWQAGGLGVFDPGINALSIITKILPHAAHLSTADLYFPENCETPIAADLDFYYDGQARMTANFDFREDGDEFWNIEIQTNAGELLLSDGGAKLSINGEAQGISETALNGEYPRLYAHMAKLVKTNAIDVDLAPMAHVADAFLLGKRHIIEPFIE